MWSKLQWKVDLHITLVFYNDIWFGQLFRGCIKRGLVSKWKMHASSPGFSSDPSQLMTMTDINVYVLLLCTSNTTRGFLQASLLPIVTIATIAQYFPILPENGFMAVDITMESFKQKWKSNHLFLKVTKTWHAQNRVCCLISILLQNSILHIK